MRTSRRLLKQARRALLVAFLFSMCVNILMLATPLYTLQIFDTVVPSGSLETLVVLTAMAAVALTVMAIVEICRDRIMLRAGLWLDHTLGQFMLENGLKQEALSADLRQNAKALGSLRAFVTGGGLGPLFDLPWVPAFLGLLYVLHPWLGLFACAVAVTLLVAAFTLNLVTTRSNAECTLARERAELWWETIARNAQLAGALGLAKGAATQWELLNRQHVSSAYTAGKRTSFIKAIVRGVRVGGQIGLYGIGGWLVITQELAPGALVASVIILSRLISPLEQLVYSLRNVQIATQAYRRLKSLPADAIVPNVTDGESAPLGRVVVADATYYFPTRRSPALRNVSLTLEPGECLGIVGPNASGKSALASLLAGAATPTTGSADLDGVPIVKWQRGEGDPPVGYVSDEPVLIEGSVHDNIARFRSATLSSVARAAARAGVHEILSGLQHGYDTEVGNGGMGLAMRERRAVALARSIHGQPRIVVLDEPELGLDGQSLRRLASVLAQFKADGIGLVIATQDPRLLGLTDKLILLNAGAVQAFGPTQQVASQMSPPDRAAAAPSHLKQVV